MALQPAQTVALIVGLAAAVWFDLHTRRIPNLLTLTMALSGALFFTVSQGPAGLMVSLQGILVGLLLFVVPFATGGLGGGDLKLAMAIGALAGPGFTWYALLYGVIAGGAIAAFILIRKWRFGAAGARKESFPYALAMAVGALAATLT